MSDWSPIISDSEWRDHQAAKFATDTDKQIDRLPHSGWDLDAENLIGSLGSPPSFLSAGGVGEDPNAISAPLPNAYPRSPTPAPNPFGLTTGMPTFGEVDDTRAGLPEAPLTTAPAMTLDTGGMGGISNDIASYLGENSAAVARADEDVWRGQAERMTGRIFQAKEGRDPTPEELQAWAPGLSQAMQTGFNVAGAGPIKGGPSSNLITAGSAVSQLGAGMGDATRDAIVRQALGQQTRFTRPGIVDQVAYRVADAGGDEAAVRAAIAQASAITARRDAGVIDTPTMQRELQAVVSGGQGIPPQVVAAVAPLSPAPAGPVKGATGWADDASRLIDDAVPNQLRLPGLDDAVPEDLRLPDPLPPNTVRQLGKAVERISDDTLPPGAREIELTSAEELARLRLDQFPEQVRPLIQQASEQSNFFHGQRRGVMPDEVSEELADQLASTRPTDQWIRGGRAGKAYNDIEIRALTNATHTQAQKVLDIEKAVASAPPGQLGDELIARQFVEGEKLVALTGLRDGAKSESGRALRAWQMESHLSKDPADAISRIFAKVGGVENARKAASDFSAMVAEGADPIQMANFWAKIERPPVNAVDWFTTLRYNSMLSGPRTFAVNLIGNTLEVPWRVSRDLLTATGRAAMGEGAAGFREVDAEILGWFTGLMKGTRPAWDVITQGITREAAEAGDLPRSISSRLDPAQAQNHPNLVRAAKPFAEFLEATGRGMNAVDELAKQAAYGMAKGRLAAREANKRGLKGEEWEALHETLTTSVNKLDDEAKDMANRMIFRNEMPPLGEALARTASEKAHPTVRLVSNLLLPFMRTVFQISSRGMDRSPLGWATTAIDVGRGAYRGGKTPQGSVPLGERLGDNLMGGMIGTWFGYQGVQGNITASGPDNAEDRDLLRAQGWQPYSLRLPNGEWVSYANWGPVAVPLSMAGAAGDSWNYRKDSQIGTLITETINRSVGLIAEQPYLQGIGAIWKAFDDFERYGSQWLVQTITSSIPYGSAINTVGQALDPAERQTAKGLSPKAIVEGVQTRIPGWRQQLPERRTITGEVLPNPYSGGRALSPVRATRATPGSDIRRYEGSTSVAMDREIQRAIDAVENWESAPERYKEPTFRQMDLHAQYAGTEQDAYMETLRTERERRQAEQVSRAR